MAFRLAAHPIRVGPGSIEPVIRVFAVFGAWGFLLVPDASSSGFFLSGSAGCSGGDVSTDMNARHHRKEGECPL